ncbi:MAG: hypothetical protein AAF513_15535 [Pseudomonadota bacterium]
MYTLCSLSFPVCFLSGRADVVPDTLYHYYEKSRGPLRSISELSQQEFTALMHEIGAQGTPENRFDEAWKRDFYLHFRPYLERTIKARFEAKGGRPRIDAPRYFTLGPSTWFLDWYKEPEALAIPLAAIPEDLVSFTFPDSMMSYLIFEDRFEPFAKFKMPYHGEVFLRHELAGLIDSYGLPDESDPRNIEHGNRIIEAQVWDLELLKTLV